MARLNTFVLAFLLSCLGSSLTIAEDAPKLDFLFRIMTPYNGTAVNAGTSVLLDVQSVGGHDGTGPNNMLAIGSDFRYCLHSMNNKSCWKDIFPKFISVPEGNVTVTVSVERPVENGRFVSNVPESHPHWLPIDAQTNFFESTPREYCNATNFGMAPCMFNRDHCVHFSSFSFFLYELPLFLSKEAETLYNELYNHPLRTDDATTACVLISIPDLHVANIVRENFELSALRLHRQKFWTNGQNHIVFWQGDYVPSFDIGRSMIAAPSFRQSKAFHKRTDFGEFIQPVERKGYDIVLPPMFYRCNYPPFTHLNKFNDATIVRPANRTILLSFKGSVYGFGPDHPAYAREVLRTAHNGRDVLVYLTCWNYSPSCEACEPPICTSPPVKRFVTHNHDKCEEWTNEADAISYDNLLLNSRFAAIVPGEGMHSYRLYEALQAGAIPVFLGESSLPFDPFIPWANFTIIHRDMSPHGMQLLIQRLRMLPPEVVDAMHVLAKIVFESNFKNLQVQLDTMFAMLANRFQASRKVLVQEYWDRIDRSITEVPEGLSVATGGAQAANATHVTLDPDSTAAAGTSTAAAPGSAASLGATETVREVQQRSSSLSLPTAAEEADRIRHAAAAGSGATAAVGVAGSGTGTSPSHDGAKQQRPVLSSSAENRRKRDQAQAHAQAGPPPAIPNAATTASGPGVLPASSDSQALQKRVNLSSELYTAALSIFSGPFTERILQVLNRVKSEQEFAEQVKPFLETVPAVADHMELCANYLLHWIYSSFPLPEHKQVEGAKPLLSDSLMHLAYIYAAAGEWRHAITANQALVFNYHKNTTAEQMQQHTRALRIAITDSRRPYNPNAGTIQRVLTTCLPFDSEYLSGYGALAHFLGPQPLGSPFAPSYALPVTIETGVPGSAQAPTLDVSQPLSSHSHLLVTNDILRQVGRDMGSLPPTLREYADKRGISLENPKIVGRSTEEDKTAETAPGTAPASPRIAIVSLCSYDSSVTNLGQLSRKNLVSYCERHNYACYLASEPVDPSRPPAWSKVVLSALYLPRYDWIMWKDCDTFFMDQSIRVEGMLQAAIESKKEIADKVSKYVNTTSLRNHAFGLSEDCDKESYVPLASATLDLITSEDAFMLNTGIYFLRNTPWSNGWLRRLYGLKSAQGNPVKKGATIDKFGLDMRQHMAHSLDRGNVDALKLLRQWNVKISSLANVESVNVVEDFPYFNTEDLDTLFHHTHQEMTTGAVMHDFFLYHRLWEQGVAFSEFSFGTGAVVRSTQEKDLVPKVLKNFGFTVSPVGKIQNYVPAGASQVPGECDMLDITEWEDVIHSHFVPQQWINSYPLEIAQQMREYDLVDSKPLHSAYKEGDWLVSFSGCNVFMPQKDCNALFARYESLSK